MTVRELVKDWGQIDPNEPGAFNRLAAHYSDLLQLALRLERKAVRSETARNSIIEECAKVCDSRVQHFGGVNDEARECAADIRALKNAAPQEMADRKDDPARQPAIAPSPNERTSELEQKLDAIAKALGYPVECWRMAGCDVMAHAIGDLIANYGRLQAQFSKIDATLDEVGAPVDCEWEGIKTRLSRRGRIKALRSSIWRSEWVPVTERLPETHDESIGWLVFDGENVSHCRNHPSWWNYKDDRDTEHDGQKVTHWMPIPKGPK